MLAHKQADIVVFVAGDSITLLRALAGTATDVSLRAATGKMNDLVDIILQKFNKMRIKYLWVPAEFNPSDYNSKKQLDPTEKSNSDIWRKGAPFFTDKKHMESKVLATVCTKSHTFQLVKQNEEVTSFSVVEDIEEEIEGPTTEHLEGHVEDELHEDEPIEDEPVEDERIEDERHDVGDEEEGDLGEPTSESQAVLFRQGVGVHKLIAAQLFPLFPENNIVVAPITAPTAINMRYLQLSPSLNLLVSGIVHNVVTPILLGRQLRGELTTDSLKMKIQLAWLYILASSQSCFPPL